VFLTAREIAENVNSENLIKCITTSGKDNFVPKEKIREAIYYGTKLGLKNSFSNLLKLCLQSENKIKKLNSLKEVEKILEKLQKNLKSKISDVEKIGCKNPRSRK